MATVEEMLEVDSENAQFQRAQKLYESDMELLRALVEKRIQRKLRQREVGAAIGVSQATVAEFERDGNDPRLSTIRRYALAVGADVLHAVVNFSDEKSATTVTAVLPSEDASYPTSSTFEDDFFEEWSRAAPKTVVVAAGSLK